jgi:hypothetical protein
MAGGAENIQGMDFDVSLIWRTDAGPDDGLYQAVVPETFDDPDAGYALFSFTTALAAVPAQCGDLIVLTVAPLPGLDDAGFVYEAYPTMVIP